MARASRAVRARGPHPWIIAKGCVTLAEQMALALVYASTPIFDSLTMAFAEPPVPSQTATAAAGSKVVLGGMVAHSYSRGSGTVTYPKKRARPSLAEFWSSMFAQVPVEGEMPERLLGSSGTLKSVPMTTLSLPAPTPRV